MYTNLIGVCYPPSKSARCLFWIICWIHFLNPILRCTTMYYYYERWCIWVKRHDCYHHLYCNIKFQFSVLYLDTKPFIREMTDKISQTVTIPVLIRATLFIPLNTLFSWSKWECLKVQGGSLSWLWNWAMLLQNSFMEIFYFA